MFGTKKGNKIKYEMNYGVSNDLPLIWLYKKSRKPIKNRAYETVDAHNDAV